MSMLNEAEYNWDEVWDKFEGDKNTFNVGHELVGKHAESSDLAVRIVDFDDGNVSETSFSELADGASQLASYLDELDLSSKARVAGMMDARRELYETFIGTLFAGHTYVPLYVLYQKEAVTFRLNNCDAEVLVTTPEHREKVNPDEIDSLEHVLIVGSEDSLQNQDVRYEEIRSRDTDYDWVETDAEDTAVIQYTSGTSGPPKGTLIPHRYPITFAPSREYTYNLTQNDEHFTIAPPAHGAGLLMGPLPLRRGMSVTTKRGRSDPKKVLDLLEQYDITSALLLPTLMRQISAVEADIDQWDLSLNQIVTGGEAVDSEAVEWFESEVGVRPRSIYGQTEVGPVISDYHFDEYEQKGTSLGKPLPGFDVAILDLEEDEVVEEGETGEVAVYNHGLLLTNGYLNKPEKTEEKWGAEWFRTGDLARRDEDGHFWYEGRADYLIMSAGHRISPGEVEESLHRLDEVDEAVATAFPDEERGQIVGAFVRPASGYEPTEALAEKISQDVRSNLSKYAYPRHIEFVEEFPRNATNKVERYKLEERAQDQETSYPPE